MTDEAPIKHIYIGEIVKNKNKNNNKNKNKNIILKKETKMRVETKIWELTQEQLLHTTQLNTLQRITNNTVVKNKYSAFINSHIKTKISGYKHQDILKNKLNIEEFVSFVEVADLLIDCGLKCHYCSNEVFILYEIVREMKQWSLDRINNDIGHNSGNLVIACLECNLKRRRTNKDAFMFTKNMVIIKNDSYQ